VEIEARVRGTLGGVVAKKLEIPVTPDLLRRLGECLVDTFSKEAEKDFAKRGWSGRAQDGTADIGESFSYRIRGGRTVEVVSTFPYLAEMVTQDSPPHKMTWLTQEAKKKHSSEFPLTPREMKLGMKTSGKRLPLVVPLKTESGTIIFRMAPLTFADAWVHPGIARFTFVQRAAKKGREGCIAIIKQEALAAVVQKLSGNG